jgi:hypothetical protein
LKIEIKLLFVISSLILMPVTTFSTPAAFAAVSTVTGLEESGQSEPSVDSAVNGFRPFVDCSVDTGDIVAFDISKNQDLSPLSTWISDLDANGFVTREVNLTQGIPNCIVKLVIEPLLSFTNCIAENYTAAEASSVANFVSNGGGLLLVSENSLLCDKGATAPVVTAMGATLLSPSCVDQVLLAGVSYDQNNPATLFKDVNSWSVLCANEYEVPTPGVVATYASGNAAMIAKQFGKGCTVMVGNIDQWRDDLISGFDNRKLGLNSLKFLNECITREVVGGEILGIDITSLFVAGAFANTSWMIPVIGGTAAGIIGFAVRKRIKSYER